MNIKKLLISGLAIGTLLVPMVADAAPSNHVAHIKGKVHRDLVVHGEDVSAETLATFKKIQDGDKDFKYFVNSDGSVDVVRSYPALAGMVFVNGQEVNVDENGYYFADVQPGKAVVEFKVQGKVHKSQVLDVKSKDNLNVDINETSQFSDVVSPMDTGISLSGTGPSTYVVIGDGGANGPYPGQTYDGQPVYTGDHVHCNRFNGVYSDHKYWSWSSWAKAISDFYQSDCDYNLMFYGCPTPPAADTLCDGLNSQGKGVHDCSDYRNWPATAWWRN